MHIKFLVHSNPKQVILTEKVTERQFCNLHQENKLSLSEGVSEGLFVGLSVCLSEGVAEGVSEGVPAPDKQV